VLDLETLTGAQATGVIPTPPATVSDYMSALDLGFVNGKKIGYNGTLTEGSPLKIAYDALVAVAAGMVPRPQTTVGSLPAVPSGYEQHKTIDEVQFRTNLPLRKAAYHKAIDDMMEHTNSDPAQPLEPVIAILGSVPSGPQAGYPQVTIPMGYSTTTRRTLDVSVNGGAYDERDLIGVA
jgi:hypothetical protein